MNKIFVIILCFLVVTGCNRNEKEINKDNIAKMSSKPNEKEYYVSKVTYINHDDYFEYDDKKNKDVVVQINNNHEVIQETTNEEIINEEEGVINEENSNIYNEIINSNVFVKEDVETKEEKLDLTNEEALSIDDVINEELSSNIELKDNNNLQVENDDIKSLNDVESEKLQVPNYPKPGYYAPNGKYLGETKVKVIDVSHHQGIINWDTFARESDCYGVILRIGYFKTLDKQFERNISEIKRLNIPYGIYLFSYASSNNGALIESEFTNEVINKYDLKPTLGIYYDIESWKTNLSSSDYITKDMYDSIVNTYINNIKRNVGDNYNIGLYSGRWYAMNRLGDVSKSYVSWVAEYNNTCKYDASYKMWQYTSKGSIPGIIGNVDISYLY